MKKTVQSKKPAKSKNDTLAELEAPSTLNENAASVIKALNEATKKKNKEFKEMSKLEKRVAIAMDVKESLRAKKYIASAGTYVDFIKTGSDFSCGITLENMLKDDVKCEVCAIGSMFLSHVKKSKSKQEIVTDDDEMCEIMDDIYTEKELRILEFFFEGSDIANTFTDNHGDIKNCYTQLSKNVEAFSDFYGDNDDGRLTAIMDNIIKNKGRFIYKSTKV